MTKILVTGANGFIGRRLVQRLLCDHGVSVLELVRSPGATQSLSNIAKTDVNHDLRAPVPDRIIERLQDVTHVVHAAAVVSGVTSLADPVTTVTTNVVGTYHMLEAVRKIRTLKKFLFISTGEVVGHISDGEADESAPLRPSNPYSASKAAGEELCRAYKKCFGVPAVTVRLMNVFGYEQDAPRFLPLACNRIMSGLPALCHVDGLGRPGSRNWMPVGECSKLVSGLLLDEKAVDDVYHIVGPELDNAEVVHALASGLEAVAYEVKAIRAPASHDLRYALRDTKSAGEYSFMDKEYVRLSLGSEARYYRKRALVKLWRPFS
jgi:dTDP-glucose 4,6-dehydratase